MITNVFKIVSCQVWTDEVWTRPEKGVRAFVWTEISKIKKVKSNVAKYNRNEFPEELKNKYCRIKFPTKLIKKYKHVATCDYCNCELKNEKGYEMKRTKVLSCSFCYETFVRNVNSEDSGRVQSVVASHPGDWGSNPDHTLRIEWHCYRQTY